ncbi:hypothetical protein IAU59_001742 [Kwoniella sp. CBS 9459]
MMTHQQQPATTSITDGVALPADIMLEVFHHLSAAGAVETLATMRQVNKAMYLLATPSLMAEYELPLRSFSNFTHELVQTSVTISRVAGGSVDANQFFSPTKAGLTLRHLHDLRYTRKLLADNSSSTATPAKTPSKPANPGPGAPEQALNVAVKKQDRQARLAPWLLPRLKTLILPSTTLRSYSLNASGLLETKEEVSPSLTHENRLVSSLTSKITTLVIRYPTVIHDDIDADLASSPIKTYLRSLIDELPHLENIRYENMHLQPIALRLPSLHADADVDAGRTSSQHHTVVFTRYARTPDMGGVIRHLREQQIISSLSLVIEAICKRVEENIFVWGRSGLNGDSDLGLNSSLRYEFVDAIRSIPQWDARDLEERKQDKIRMENTIRLALDKQFRSRAEGNMIARVALEFVKSRIYLTEADV